MAIVNKQTKPGISYAISMRLLQKPKPPKYIICSKKDLGHFSFVEGNPNIPVLVLSYMTCCLPDIST